MYSAVHSTYYLLALASSFQDSRTNKPGLKWIRFPGMGRGGKIRRHPEEKGIPTDDTRRSHVEWHEWTSHAVPEPTQGNGYLIHVCHQQQPRPHLFERRPPLPGNRAADIHAQQRASSPATQSFNTRG